jgi:hypothetical protein
MKIKFLILWPLQTLLMKIPGAYSAVKHIGSMNALCPYNVGHQQVNNMDCFMEFPQINITDIEHQEAMKEVARAARMVVIKNLDQESQEKLKR